MLDAGFLILDTGSGPVIQKVFPFLNSIQYPASSIQYRLYVKKSPAAGQDFKSVLEQR